MQDISWLTSEQAAAALSDVLLDGEEPVLHLVHPHPVPWAIVIEAFAEELELPIVPYDDWLSMLEESGRVFDASSQTQDSIEQTFEKNPALRLLSFFVGARNRIAEKYEPLGVPKLETGKAQATSVSLRNSRQINGEDVRRWVRYWRSTGFLSSGGN